MTRSLYSISKVWHTRKHRVVQEPSIDGGLGRYSLHVLIKSHTHRWPDDANLIVQ